MAILITISLIFAFFAVYFLLRMFHGIRRRRIVRASSSCVTSLVFAAAAGAGSMLLLNYLSYERLTAEQLVSRVEFRKIATDEFQARIMVPGRDDRIYALRGDEWQMDAKIVTWTPPMTILGLDPIYQLDRLSGRFAEIDREQTERRTVHSLATESPADVWRVARRFPLLMPGIDAQYGTATFVPMADGALFEVSLSRDALIARPANDRAREAVSGWAGN